MKIRLTSLFTHASLCLFLQAQGKLAEAEPLYQRAIAIWEKILGPDHPTVAGGVNNLAMLLQDQGKLDEAGPLLPQAMEGYCELQGDRHIIAHPHLSQQPRSAAATPRQTGRGGAFVAPTAGRTS